MKILYTIAFMVFTTYGFAQNNWELVYENDANGNPIAGTLDELITSIQNGDDIRIYFRMGRPSQPEVFVEHTVLVKFTTIMNSPKGKFVTAQIDPIVGQVPNFEKEIVLLKENLEWSLIASSNGNNDTMTKNVITGEIINHGQIRWGTKWFVEK